MYQIDIYRNGVKQASVTAGDLLKCWRKAYMSGHIPYRSLFPVRVEDCKQEWETKDGRLRVVVNYTGGFRVFSKD